MFDFKSIIRKSGNFVKQPYFERFGKLKKVGKVTFGKLGKSQKKLKSYFWNSGKVIFPEKAKVAKSWGKVGEKLEKVTFGDMES